MKIKMHWLTATLELYDVNGARRASDDDWKDTQQKCDCGHGFGTTKRF
jgi:hypothetical protein